ncbi:MAG: glycosyltransferase, partial [Candidatus Methanoperedens sp.]|nr:glycosyltransferase [Candidatus Methanoperedens sp.]
FLSSADICIVPLRFGSGTRLKILEYMAACKPVISTSKGAEGIEYVDKENIIIEDNINNFVGIIKELLNEENRACEIGKSAEKLIKQKYEWNLYSNTLNDVYKIALNDI